MLWGSPVTSDPDSGSVRLQVGWAVIVSAGAALTYHNRSNDRTGARSC